MAFYDIDKNRRENTKKRNVKKYRRINLGGIIIFLLVIAVSLLFIKDDSGNNVWSKLGHGNSSNVVHASFTKEQAQNIKILIDAGHGGFDDGATSPFIDKKESVLNLEVANALKQELTDIGFKVEMTRKDSNALGATKNEDMKARQEMIYNSDADIVISVHMNTHDDRSVNGPIVFHMPGSTKGLQLSKMIQASMNEELKPKSPKSPQSQNFLVLRSGNMPCVLIECGFLTNKDEAAKLGSSAYHKRIAQSVSWGIMDYFAQGA